MIDQTTTITHELAMRRVVSEILSNQRPTNLEANYAILVFVIVCEVLFLRAWAVWFVKWVKT